MDQKQIKSLFNYLKPFLKNDKVLNRWLEPHRYYHDVNHLQYLVDRIRLISDNFHENIIEKLIIIAVYHDCVYDPKANASTGITNETASAEIYKKDYGVKYDPEIYNAILDTHYDGRVPSSVISKIFMELDLSGFKLDFDGLKKNEDLLFKEFQFVPYPKYVEGKLKVLETFKDQIIDSNYDMIVNYVKNRKPKIGLYAGSFAPFHKGHLDVLKQSEQVFDKVIIACGHNPDKKKQSNIPNFLKYHQVENYYGLLTDYIQSLDYEVTLIRGIRNATDLTYEATLKSYLQDLMPDIKIVYFLSNPELVHLSSSAINSLPEGKQWMYIPQEKDYYDKY